MQLPEMMHAMVLQIPGTSLVYREVPVPEPGPEQVLIKVHACGVCRTDLHVVDGELSEEAAGAADARAAPLPIIPGHQIVGVVAGHGRGVSAPALGTRVGVPWLSSTCGGSRLSPAI